MIKQERYEYLDALRGVAAFIVVIHHLYSAYSLPPAWRFLDATPLRTFWDGKGSVELFFVLSGFVLSLKYFRSTQELRRFSYVEYGVYRLFRLMPLFLAVLVLSAIARNFLFHPYHTIPEPVGYWMNRHSALWSQPISVSQVLKEALLIIRIPEESYARLISQDWSLTIELKQSLLLPLLIIVAHRSQLLLLGLFACYMAMRPNTATFNFYVGIVIAQNLPFIRRQWQEMPGYAKYGLLLLTVGLYSVSPLMIQEDVLKTRLIALGCGLGIAIVLCSKTCQQWLRLRVLAFLGKISYSLYLVHMLFIICVAPFFISLLNRVGITDEYIPRLLTLALVMGLSIGLSMLTYQFIEKPFIKLGKRTTRWISQFDMLRLLPQILLNWVFRRLRALRKANAM